MLQFKIAEAVCNGCGACAKDCPARIITFADGHPAIAPDDEEKCTRCQHCLAVCPTGALSIFGLDPADSRPLVPGAYPEPERLETLILGRRSFRQYRDDNVDPALLERLLTVAWAAPTGVNSRQTHLFVIDDRAMMDRFRAEVLDRLRPLAAQGALPPRLAHFARFVEVWDDKGVDVIFRGAPHIVIATAPAAAPTPVQDGLIALSTFDLLAQAEGLGTVWGGLAYLAIRFLVPEVRATLGIPEDHEIAYTMLFGYPKVRYHRTVQRGVPAIHRVN
jgi:nitroreductase/NAD-dependent dihydropyrimidine dehydrogenase PreA subunit